MKNKCFSEKFMPRFSDTDALGHINNTMIPIWFEGARDEVFRWFSPSLNLSKWPLILAKIEVNFHAQLYYGKQIEVRTFIQRIGSSSFDVLQEVWQGDEVKVSGVAVMVHFDFKKQSSVKIPSEIIDKMKEYLKN